MSVEFHPLLQYIETLSGEEDELLNQLNRETHLKVVNPRMLSGHVQGKFLEFISRMLKPKSILEIGTYTGYSAICLARGLQPGGKLVTIEKNDELSAYSHKYFKLAGLEDKIELWVGNALEIIPLLDMQFDLVFIDGEKREYPEYYQQAMGKMTDNSYLIADNVLWGGKVVSEAASDDPETSAIRKFNEMVKNDPRVDNVILSIRDGLSMVQKKS